jgi:cyclic pyranopterin monophosphate synthase
VTKTLSHLDEKGQAKMVDVTVKEPSLREAVARGRILMSPHTLALIQEGRMPKGDVFSVARVAGSMAAKKTGELIPMCHPLALTYIEIRFDSRPETGEVLIESQAKLIGRTGAEMGALTAVSMAALTIYDMCKAVDKKMVITDIMLMRKLGGKRQKLLGSGQTAIN